MPDVRQAIPPLRTSVSPSVEWAQVRRKAELDKVRAVSRTAQGLGLLVRGICGCGPLVTLRICRHLGKPIRLREGEEESEDKEKSQEESE